MAFIVGDLLEIVHRSQQELQLGLFITHWLVSGTTAPPPTEQEVVNFYNGTVGPLVHPLLNNQAYYVGSTIQVVRPLPMGNLWRSEQVAFTGTAGASALPKQCSGIISKYGAVSGQEHRGRVYVPFPSESDNSSLGAPENAYVTRLRTLRDFLFTNQVLTLSVIPLIAITLAPRLYHRTDGTHEQVVTSLARQKWATQRRRGDYGKVNPPA